MILFYYKMKCEVYSCYSKHFPQCNANGHVLYVRKKLKTKCSSFSDPPLAGCCVSSLFFFSDNMSLYSVSRFLRNAIIREPSILKRQKSILISCPCSPKGMLGVFFLLLIGILLRYTSCLFCIVFAKMPVA